MRIFFTGKQHTIICETVFYKNVLQCFTKFCLTLQKRSKTLHIGLLNNLVFDLICLTA